MSGLFDIGGERISGSDWVSDPEKNVVWIITGHEMGRISNGTEYVDFILMADSPKQVKGKLFKHRIFNTENEVDTVTGKILRYGGKIGLRILASAVGMTQKDSDGHTIIRPFNAKDLDGLRFVSDLEMNSKGYLRLKDVRAYSELQEDALAAHEFRFEDSTLDVPARSPLSF